MHQLQDGDIIILATDGIVFIDEIASIVNEELSSNNRDTRTVDVEELAYLYNTRKTLLSYNYNTLYVINHNFNIYVILQVCSNF